MMDKKGKYLAVWGRYEEMLHDEQLTDAEVGKLLRWMFDYQFSGRKPEKVSPRLRGYWLFLRQDIDNAQSSYESKVENGRKGGQKSAQLRREQDRENEEAQAVLGTSQANASTKEAEASTTQAASSTTQALSSDFKQNQQRTRTESRTESKSESNKYTGSAPASEEAGICGEKNRFGEFGWVRLTKAEYRRLEKLMGSGTLQKCIEYVDRSAQTTGNKNRWKDWYILLQRCYEGKWYKSRSAGREPVPMGATGYLGPAELGAIQKLMREDIPDVVLPEERQPA